MFYWKYSANRMFFLNEYWIFIPLTAGSNYFIIKKIRSQKERTRKLKELQEKIERYEREERIRRIIYLASSLSTVSYVSMCRGGTNVIDVTHIDCGIEKGVRFLDHERLRKIIHDLYSYKRRSKMIYITLGSVILQ